MRKSWGSPKEWKIVNILASLYRVRLLRFFIPAAVIGLIYWEAKKELRQVDFGRALHLFRSLPTGEWAWLLTISLLAVASMSVYDFLIRGLYRLPLRASDTFRYAWIANTTNNLVGFAGVTGASLRMILYRNKQVPSKTLFRAVAFLSPISITGLSVLAWLGIFEVIPMRSAYPSYSWQIVAAWAVALYLPAFAFFQRTPLFAKWFRRDEGRFTWKMIGYGIGSSFIEWFFAGITFWLISLAMLPSPISIGHAYSIYTVSAIAGIISLVPGGLGGFDLTALIGFRRFGYGPDHAAAVLITFRMFYYLVPWFIGLIISAFEFSNNRNVQGSKDDDDAEEMEKALTGWQKIWNWPGRVGFIGELGAWSLGKLVFLSGLTLLSSAATPGLWRRLHVAEEILSIPLMKLSLQLSVIIGIMLIVLSRGISLRIKRAYRWTLFLIVAGAIFTLIKAFDFEEAIFLLIVAVLLWLSRDRFYRIGVPFSREQIAKWGLATFLLFWIYDLIASRTHPGSTRRIPPNADIRWLFTPQEQQTTIILGLAIAWLIFSMLWVLRPVRMGRYGATQGQRLKLQSFLEVNQGNLLTHMLFSGDKSFYWAAEHQVLIPFAKVRNKLAILSDPIGKPELISGAIQEFQGYADRYALKVVFYQVSPEYLPIYHENGFRFFKLGEDAIVPLNTFTLSGKRNTNLRTVKNRFEREGFHFEVLKPPFNSIVIERLQKISNDWLKGRHEKGYSLGWFQETYLQLAPIAILKDGGGLIIAFATLAPGYDDGSTLSIDLMRHLKETPNGTMDMLFISLLDWAKENGYSRFNLGMAPLSRVGQSHGAMREEKLARLVFRYGSHWYGFEGLRKYKQKFSPAWEPRYLAYPRGLYLPTLLLELVWLISRRPRVPNESNS
ncbi:bifunctional lysylphosphatidylglycerol flippase/synthetase MprF [Gorillibacterium massiliense]|uniref:bifunctional lysylphosphatidylglycerol flippase/synthetase MprF n=1 Tax=Gorillibacterium massiliense TaxID=1280390 RepID=UPI0004B83DC2|nr:bifunctional lysylphosphatidylglycerol flippase/synthetase MprF [Gorillibacterium massiliense]